MMSAMLPAIATISVMVTANLLARAMLRRM